MSSENNEESKPKKDLALRYNEGKPRLSLIEPDFILGLGEVLTFGATKYKAHNWKKGMYTSFIIDSLMRHLMKFINKEDIDSESKLKHLDHIACNLMFLRHYAGTEFDDR